MVWLSHLPQNCPPPQAITASGEVYRLVNHNSPHSEDFRSWREENMDKELPQGVSECQAGGLSVFKDKADAYRIIRKIPRFRKAKPSLGILTPNLGKILCNPSQSSQSHHTWWVPANEKPWTVFQVTNVD